MDGLQWKTLLKWMIWGYHSFRKHPNLAPTQLDSKNFPTWNSREALCLQLTGDSSFRAITTSGAKKVMEKICCNSCESQLFPDLGVSKNNGTPKSSIIIGLCIINKPVILGYPYFWKHPFRTWENGEEYPISQPSAHPETDVPPPAKKFDQSAAHEFQLPSAFEGTAKPKPRHLFSEC